MSSPGKRTTKHSNVFYLREKVLLKKHTLEVRLLLSHIPEYSSMKCISMCILRLLTHAFQESDDMDAEDSPCPSDSCGQLNVPSSEGEIQPYFLLNFQIYERIYAILIKHSCFAV